MIKLLSILLSLALISHNADNCKQNLLQVLETAAPKKLPAGKIISVKIKTRVIMRDSLQQSNFKEESILMYDESNYQMVSNFTEVYADKLSTVMVSHMAKQVIVNPSLPQDLIKMRTGSIASLRDSIIQYASVEYCRKKGIYDEILLKPSMAIAKEHKIESLYFLTDTKSKLLQYKVNYAKPKDILFIDTEFVNLPITTQSSAKFNQNHHQYHLRR